MMNETTTLFENSYDKQLFAEIIIGVIESKHRRYECEHRESRSKRVPLADIHFRIVHALNGGFYGIGDDENNIGGPDLQEIAKMQGNPNEYLLLTAQRMLDLFQQIGEIIKTTEDSIVYKLHKDGLIYKYLAETLESTP